MHVVRWMIATSGHPRDLEETAGRQIERPGYAAEDIRHVALTRLHFDHAGGLPDFPQAKVQIVSSLSVVGHNRRAEAF